MNKLFGTAILATSLLAAHSALAADLASETRSIDARITNVRLNGVVDLRIKQGATPSLVVWGDSGHIQKVTTVQQGDTLKVDTGREFRTNRDQHRLRVDLTVPNLADFVSQGVGGTDISGFAGERLRVALDGAGTVNLDSRYRNLDARLGGAGGLTINAADAERVELELGGAGHINIKGQARTLRARMAGVGGLDARELRADTVDLDVSGLGSASVFAKTTANVSLSGLGSARVYGQPANRNATTSGMGKVNWQ
jgi:hypothetical protein